MVVPDVLCVRLSSSYNVLHRVWQHWNLARLHQPNRLTIHSRLWALTGATVLYAFQVQNTTLNFYVGDIFSS
jgi:hypothetical protein